MLSVPRSNFLLFQSIFSYLARPSRVVWRNSTWSSIENSTNSCLFAAAFMFSLAVTFRPCEFVLELLTFNEWLLARTRVENLMPRSRVVCDRLRRSSFNEALSLPGITAEGKVGKDEKACGVWSDTSGSLVARINSVDLPLRATRYSSLRNYAMLIKCQLIKDNACFLETWACI